MGGRGESMHCQGTWACSGAGSALQALCRQVKYLGDRIMLHGPGEKMGCVTLPFLRSIIMMPQMNQVLPIPLSHTLRGASKSPWQPANAYCGGVGGRQTVPPSRGDACVWADWGSNPAVVYKWGDMMPGPGHLCLHLQWGYPGAPTNTVTPLSPGRDCRSVWPGTGPQGPPCEAQLP